MTGDGLDGRVVLARILHAGGRIRLDVINDVMAAAALESARALLSQYDLPSDDQRRLREVSARITKVLAARARVRGRQG